MLGESCKIITTTANDLVQAIHDRMPVILAPADYGAWLDPTTPAEALQALLRPFPSEGMEAVPVGTYVSNPRNEGPQWLASGGRRLNGGKLCRGVTTAPGAPAPRAGKAGFTLAPTTS